MKILQWIHPSLPFMPKRIKEDKYFKTNFWTFVVRHYSTGIEMWACRCKPNDTRQVLIGKIKGGQLVKPDNFYTFDWHVQKGAERLFRILGI